MLQYRTQFFRMFLWYSPPPHPETFHSASFFFHPVYHLLNTTSQAGDERCGNVLIYIGDSLVQSSFKFLVRSECQIKLNMENYVNIYHMCFESPFKI